MIEDRSVVEQALEIHMLAKDLKNCSKETPCVLPNKFVAGCIIFKLPPSWRDFATSLKHKRQKFTNDGLIGTLDVEEKARAKDTRGKGIVGIVAKDTRVKILCHVCVESKQTRKPHKLAEARNLAPLEIIHPICAK